MNFLPPMIWFGLSSWSILAYFLNISIETGNKALNVVQHLAMVGHSPDTLTLMAIRINSLRGLPKFVGFLHLQDK